VAERAPHEHDQRHEEHPLRPEIVDPLAGAYWNASDRQRRSRGLTLGSLGEGSWRSARSSCASVRAPCASSRRSFLSAYSDLRRPIEIADARLPRGVVVLNPNTEHAHKLEAVASGYVRIKNACSGRASSPTR
jgi:hypothetical protein